MSFYSALVNAGFIKDVEDNNGAFISFLSAGIGAQEQTALETFDHFGSVYSLTTGYFVNGPPDQFAFMYYPTAAVINLRTGELVRMLGESEDTSEFAADVIAEVIAANQ